MKKRGGAHSKSGKPSDKEKASTPSTMERVEGMLKLLESDRNPEVDRKQALDTLLQLYREISIKNKIDSKREELLQQEIVDLQRKNTEASDEIKSLQQEYHSNELKVIKLENLSRTLSNRVKSVESKASEDVKAEKEDRLRLSYEFSAKIKDISAKLEELSKRRESIITENARLKDVLRECFEQFDNDPDFEMSTDAENALNQVDGEENVESDTELEPERRLEKKERAAMEREEDKARLQSLREQEAVLHMQSSKFMEIFDSFQHRLADSNQLFKLKQGRVEDIAKDIKNVEKQNNDMTARIAECAVTAKTLSEAIEVTRDEKLKYEKLIDKQKSLMEKFQGDITELEAQR